MIYDASPHPLLDINLAKCRMGTTPRERLQWAITMLKQLEQLPDVEQADKKRRNWGHGHGGTTSPKRASHNNT